MKVSQLKQLIKEAVQERIRMIDEAGDIAAVEAKINKVEEDIQDAMRVKSALLDMAGLKYYVEPEIISDMMDDMEASIKELQDKKKEFEESKKQMTKPVKGAKKDKKSEDKPAPINEAEGNLNQVRNELIDLFQPYGTFKILDMTMKGQNTGTEFRVYANSKGANWKDLENFMKNNSNFTIKNISKQTFDNPKSIDFSYKKSPMMAGFGKMEETNSLGEKLKPSMGAGAYVDDFRKSKAPQFKGKSKAKKQDMAVAAYLGAKQK
jgi:ribosomal protein S13